MKQILIINCVILIVGAALGGALVYKSKAKPTSSVQTKTLVQNHVVTVTKTVIAPNGAREIDQTITDNTVHDIIQDKINNKVPQWHVSLGASVDGKLLPSYNLQVERRLIGPLFIGARVETRGALGLVIAVEF